MLSPWRPVVEGGGSCGPLANRFLSGDVTRVSPVAAPPIDSDAVMAGMKRKLARARALLDALLDDIDRVLTAGSEGPPRQNSDGTLSSIYIPREGPSPA